ncbi:hypothetical protein Leryth_016988 [Lithospermum erythrorhizon]|nr:hypothetical protein Leryth_016988 [Lithospermum erythrorhizon]
MAASPAKFLFGFLFISIILWLLFIFASRLVAWVLSRVMGASVEFRVSGWKCLRDVNVKFKEGAIESVSVGEIRLSVRQSLVKLGVGFMSKDPKLQVLICDLEIVTRASKKKSSQKAKSQRSRTSGRGKWMVVANVARFLSVCITELLVKTPKATLEVKELVVDISKVGGSKPALFVKLHLVPIYVHLDESRVVSDQTAVAIGSYSPSQTLASTERSSAPFSCEEFSLLCEFGHDRYAGIVARNLDITIGEVSINLDDNLFWGKRDSANTFQPADELSKTSSESAAANITCRNQSSSVATKYASIFPEKISFTLPKLDVKFVHREHGIVIDNNIMGIEMRSVRSQINEDVGESMRLDMQMEFREIHILRQAGISIVEIMKLDVIASAYLPLQMLCALQPATPIRSEIDIKLGGTQFNLIVTRFIPLLKLHSLEKNKVARPNGSLLKEKSRSTEHKNLLWTCTVSAPEMTLVLYSLNDQPLYHCCSQSSHVFANNISSTGASVHMELGELNLHMSDEYQECLRESLFCVETNTGPLMHIAKISLDLGKKDMELPDDGLKLKMVISVDVSGMGICLTFKRLESLISTSLSFKDELKKIPFSKKSSQEHAVKRSRTPKRVIQLLNVNLEKCSINMCGEVGLEKMDLPDIKRVNFGSQGGRTTISVSADGTPRTAYIMSTVADEYKKMEYCAYLDIFHLTFSMDMEKRSIQMDIRRARSVYQELLEDSSPGTKVTLIDMQNAKLVRRSGGLKEISVCSLFSATDIAVRWEPDVHIALVELGLHLKSLTSKYKVEGLSNVVDLNTVKNDEQNEMVSGSGTIEKQKKRESIFAVDVEMLRISAEVGDGVESLIQVQSIFSENAQIGVLLEGILFDLNDARILKSSRMQISRVPNTANNVLTAKSEMSRTWDWVIQALDVHICMPYRLQLRAIDDSIEEMLRAVKLIVAAKTQSIFPIKKGSDKPKKSSSSRVGCLRFCIRKLAVEIEEEPLQGWLDEHYQLLKNEACELAVRFKFLDDLMPKSRADMNEFSNFVYNGEKIDPLNPLAIKALQDEIYKESFRSYYQACRNLKPSEGSGACKVGFQAGFKPKFDVTLTRIEGGEAGMIEVVQQLDPVSQGHIILFARLYGGNLKLNTGSLVATCFSLKYIACLCWEWRKVQMLQLSQWNDSTCQNILDLPLHFEKGKYVMVLGLSLYLLDMLFLHCGSSVRANLEHEEILTCDPLPPKRKEFTFGGMR